MRLRFCFHLLAVLPLLAPALVHAQTSRLTGQLGFYDDNEELADPFAGRQTLEGVRFQSAWTLATGPSTDLRLGVFLDNRQEDPQWVRLKPLLSFEYHQGGTRLIMGTLQSQDRHGLLEPLEDPLLSFARPVEYGLQWLQKDEGFGADVFLDWQQVDQPGQDEIFDYGAVLTAPLGPAADLQMQLHAYHEGGRIFNIRVVNNYNPALGLRLHQDLGFLGPSGLDLFAVTSSDFEGKFDLGPDWGRGIYVKGRVTPGGWVELYGIYWNAQDFFSEEGDPQYNSQGNPASFYRADRVYAEAGLREDLKLETADLQAQLKSAWSDEFWGWALRLTLEVPVDLELPLGAQAPGQKEGPDAL
ncbi:MAG TPA: hypothetical protein VMU88_09030 [bacterium]|nr:hypothetical protein [bacterium]